MQHAKLSPSSSSRWLTCTASVKMSEQYENTTNTAAEWGTNVHFIGEQLLKGKSINVGDELQERGNKSFIVDKEMLDCAEQYVDYVRSFMVNGYDELLIEEQFDLSFIAKGQFGTSDASLLVGSHLHIFDLKTGRNIVTAEENTQLMLYALGAIYDLETFGYNIEKITLHIVQTRVNHIDSWETTYRHLVDFEKRAIDSATKILNDDTEFNPDKKACMWCPHKANCEALKNHVEEVVKSGFDDISEIDGKANLISDDSIKKILDNADLITDFIKAVKETAVERLQAGEKIDGYKLVESRTNRKFSDETKVVEYLESKDDGVDYYKPKQLKPMGQILKLLKDDEKINDFIIKPKGVAVIAPVTDKRKEITNVSCNFDEI